MDVLFPRQRGFSIVLFKEDTMVWLITKYKAFLMKSSCSSTFRCQTLLPLSPRDIVESLGAKIVNSFA